MRKPNTEYILFPPSQILLTLNLSWILPLSIIFVTPLSHLLPVSTVNNQTLYPIINPQLTLNVL